MKKILSLLLLSLLIFGCSKDTIERISVETQQGVTTYQDIDEDTYMNKIENNDSFVIYFYGQLCGSCASFSPLAEEVIENNNLVIYRIDHAIVESEYKTQYTPGINIYDNGEVMVSVDEVSDADIFESANSFYDFLNTYIVLD